MRIIPTYYNRRIVPYSTNRLRMGQEKPKCLELLARRRNHCTPVCFMSSLPYIALQLMSLARRNYVNPRFKIGKCFVSPVNFLSSTIPKSKATSLYGAAGNKTNRPDLATSDLATSGIWRSMWDRLKTEISLMVVQQLEFLKASIQEKCTASTKRFNVFENLSND